MKTVFTVVLCLLMASNVTAQKDLVKHDGAAVNLARQFLKQQNLDVDLDLDYSVLQIHKDDMLNQVHVRFQPVINGFPVYGAHTIVHTDARSGAVLGSTGKLEQPALRPMAKKPLDPTDALPKAMRDIKVDDFAMVDTLEPAYVMDKNNSPVFSFTAMVEYTTKEGPQLDRVFLDAATGEMVARHPEHHYARNRRTYSANNGTSLPGSLVRTESSGNSGDSCLDDAHNFAGITYDYFSARHGRDSLNNNGMTITSTVHYSSNYNNAFWNGSQMVYGDGDGNVFSCLSGDLDVVGHELSHGVTDFSADLIYQNESGALNEATSDIFAAAIEAYNGDSSSNIWRIGEDIYTPNGSTSDALRYMNNPTTDGSSTDYYPERYVGSADNGGVHWNSGIANLFFYLLSEGGTHPRGKTTTQVTGIGIQNAADIWYRALTVYMGPSTTFAQARNHTLSAASDLFGGSSNSYAQVQNAWAAVGVGSPAGGGGGGGGGGGSSELQNGTPVTGLSASTGNWVQYTIDVPSGATDLNVNMSGGTGDADLYVRFGAAPTTSSYDCRPYRNGNSESCSFATPSAGTYYVYVRAYSTFSGVTLTASYTAPSGGGNCGNSGSASNISASASQWKYYTFNVDACATSLTVKIEGGSGDADLYVRYGTRPTTSAYDCRPYLNGNNETCTINNPSAGTYHIGIRAYNAFSGVKLTASYE